jgi:hypothetical protein
MEVSLKILADHLAGLFERAAEESGGWRHHSPLK